MMKKASYLVQGAGLFLMSAGLTLVAVKHADVTLLCLFGILAWYEGKSMREGKWL